MLCEQGSTSDGDQSLSLVWLIWRNLIQDVAQTAYDTSNCILMSFSQRLWNHMGNSNCIIRAVQKIYRNRYKVCAK